VRIPWKGLQWQQLRFLEECQQSGVSLYIGNQPVDDSRSGRLLFGIRSNLDEDAKALLLERTRQGKEQRARAGLPSGGQAPFGYEVIYPSPRPSAWVINEAEAKVVEDIYRWYLDGMSMLNIAKRLSAQERQRLQQDIEGHKVSLSGCDEEWARMIGGICSQDCQYPRSRRPWPIPR
jgi:hypothetical protein